MKMENVSAAVLGAVQIKVSNTSAKQKNLYISLDDLEVDH